MPELPEVEAFKSYVSRILLNEIKEFAIRDERFFVTSIKDFRKKLVGSYFESVERRGKFLIVNLNPSSLKLVFHFGMTGDLSYVKTGAPEEKYVRLIIVFHNGYELRVIDQRRFGKVYLAESIDEIKTIRNMGLEPLEMNKNEFLEKCNKHLRRMVKSFLMDQSIIAGIGNIYSDEILFQAKIRPDRKIISLTEEERSKIFIETKKTLRKAVEANADFNKLKGFLLLFREKGANCPNCGDNLEALKITNRTAYYCPKCQH